MIRRVALGLVVSIGLVAIAAALTIGYHLFAPDQQLYRAQFRAGNELVRKVESFRRARGLLPTVMSDLGESATTEFQLYYEKCSETHYIIWFGATLGESMTYASKLQAWEAASGGCQQ